MSDTTNSDPSPTYYPPSSDVFDQLAFSACDELGSEFGDPEIARGLAGFLNTVARIQANNLNRKNHVDASPDFSGAA